MSAVANSSRLIIFAKLDCFDYLRTLFSQLYISEEIHREVVISGAGLPGASEVAKAEWVEVRQLQNQSELFTARKEHALGIGEISAILLAKQLNANTVLLDDYKARKLARAKGLQVQGSMGLLETLYMRGHLADLRGTFQKLLAYSYIDQKFLDHRLRALGLPPL